MWKLETGQKTYSHMMNTKSSYSCHPSIGQDGNLSRFPKAHCSLATSEVKTCTAAKAKAAATNCDAVREQNGPPIDRTHQETRNTWFWLGEIYTNYRISRYSEHLQLCAKIEWSKYAKITRNDMSKNQTSLQRNQRIGPKVYKSFVR